MGVRRLAVANGPDIFQMLLVVMKLSPLKQYYALDGIAIWLIHLFFSIR